MARLSPDATVPPTDDLSPVIDCGGHGIHAAFEQAEVEHLPVLPKERALSDRQHVDETDDMTAGIDGHRPRALVGARLPVQRLQALHRAIVPDEGQPLAGVLKSWCR